MSGRKMSSVMAAGLYSRASASAAAPCDVTRPLKPFSRAASSRKRANAEIVLDDQQHAVAGLDVVAVVADLVDERASRLGRPLGERVDRRLAASIGRVDGGRSARRRAGASVAASTPARRRAACAARAAACRLPAGTA